MRFLNRSAVLALAALLVGVPAAAQTADPDAGWETYLFFKEISPQVAARPKAMSLPDPASRHWALWPKAPPLPRDLRRRVFVNESYVVLDVDPRGKATGCRPLRPSAEPRLDAMSCELLMRPGFFSAYLLSPDPPKAAEQWVIGASWQRVDPATARRNAAKPLPVIMVAPPPAAAPAKKP